MSQAFFASLAAHFEAIESELNALDAATGDGDHGATMLKGLRAAAGVPDGAAKAYRVAAGGASGSLFSLLIGALEAVIAGRTPLGDALEGAAGRIAQMGEAKAGDKTMLDALIPAAQAAQADPDDAAGAAARAAQAGAEETVAMTARRGRARHVEGAGVGHLDAGARSVFELLNEFARQQAEAR